MKSLSRRARYLMDFLFQFGTGLRRTLGKSASATQPDAYPRWEVNGRSFCEVVTASGAKWICNGYGNFQFLERQDIELEAAIGEFLDYLGLPSGMFCKDALEGSIRREDLTRQMAALYKVGMLLPVQYLQRTYDTQCKQTCRGSSRLIQERGDQPGHRSRAHQRQCAGRVDCTHQCMIDRFKHGSTPLSVGTGKPDYSQRDRSRQFSGARS